ncbi:hypothetical protein MMC09_003523 [Bachmanniomyces sp. S44760]|nr:hypothetical protein [Bachmanniomyces sp. S44760]
MANFGDRISSLSKHLAPGTPPPFNRSTSEAPVTPATPFSPGTTGADELLPQSRPLAFSSASFQRPKKRVMWRGKTLVIALPIQDGSEALLGSHKYLKPAEVAKRLNDWEEKGYNVRGFTLQPEAPNGHSREIYPDIAGLQCERESAPCIVNIPDRAAWLAYVDQLREERLRALGVSSGDDEKPAGRSPQITSMSRQASSHKSSWTRSPSLAPSPVVSNRGSQPSNTFSPPHALTPIHPSQGPSPRLQQGLNAVTQASHPARVPLPHEQSTGPPFLFAPQSLSPSMNNSLQPPNHPGSIGGHSIHYPNGSPRGSRGMASKSTQQPEQEQLDQDSRLAQMRQQQAQLQARLHEQQQEQQQHLNPGQTLGDYRPLEVEDDRPPPTYRSQPEIASPLPHGHRYNPSETLQKEIDDAESHLEESMRRQLDDDAMRDMQLSPENPYASQLPSMNGHLLANGVFPQAKFPTTDGSDIDTNPSVSYTPASTQKVDVPPQIEAESYSGKPLASKLNVNAPEFKLETKPTSPSMFTFGKPGPGLAAIENGASGPQALGPSHIRHVSEVKRTFNVTAPEFKPLNIAAPEFTPGQLPPSFKPARVFSFSSSLPSLNADAPEFRPGEILLNRGSGSEQSASERPPNRLFGNIDFSGNIKAPAEPKAVPIVETHNRFLENARDTEGQEDESGRITQAEGRQKRMRRQGDDGDQVPLFATPISEAPKLQVDEPSPTLDGTNANASKIPEIEKTFGQLQEIIGGMPRSEVSSMVGDHIISDVDDNQSEEYRFLDPREAAMFNSVLPHVSPPDSHDGHGLDGEVSPLSDSGRYSLKPTMYHNKPKRRSFTANDPFEYNPHEPISDLPPVLPPHVPVPHPVRGGLAGSRFAPPVAATAPSLDTTQDLTVNGALEPAAVGSSVPAADLNGVSYIPSTKLTENLMNHLGSEPPESKYEQNSGPWRRQSRSRSPVSELSESYNEDRIQDQVQTKKASSVDEDQVSHPYEPARHLDSQSPESVIAEIVARNARYSPSYKPPKHSGITLDPPFGTLGSVDSAPVSDWNDVVSSTEEAKFQSKSAFFDHRINDVVGAVVRRHLDPVESTLNTIKESLAKLSGGSNTVRSKRSSSADIEHSDADDEDEDVRLTLPSGIKSPLQSRKFEKLKNILLDALASQQVSAVGPDISKLEGNIRELKESVSQQRTIPTIDIKSAVEDAMAKQFRGKSAPIISSHQSATAEKFELQITGLESMLKVAESRADDEFRSRRLTEDKLAESERNLRLAQADAAGQRESAEETERSLRAFHDERHKSMRQTSLLEDAQSDLQRTNAGLTHKCVALEETLDEYRLSNRQQQDRLEDAQVDNRNLNRTINALKNELEGGIATRQELRVKIDRLQNDMTTMVSDIAKDQASWRYKDEENKARYTNLIAQADVDSRIREKLELQIESLELQQNESIKALLVLEPLQRENARLEALVSDLQAENAINKKLAATSDAELGLERDLKEMELSRVRGSMQAEVDIEKIRVEEMNRQLEDTKARYGLLLEEASDSKSNALRDAAEAREAAVQEHYRFHERSLEEIRSHHERSLNTAEEDKQRLASLFQARLDLANDNTQHHKERVIHFEEKLEIAKSAAHAAIQAAQAAKSISAPPTKATTFVRGSEIPEKISPQALRESILVLQEQLQDRESRIETMEAESVPNAAEKIKERDIEITWLRELLGVRIDDLQDIITTLSQPAYDRDAVRNAVIRLKANLQMEQQEKERASSLGGVSQVIPTPTIPSGYALSNISNLVASPRALPMSAAAAWGNFRRGRESVFGSLSELAGGGTMGGQQSPNQTPSKPSPSQSFLSGLLTPPSTTLRQTPPAGGDVTAPTTTKASVRPAYSASAGHRPLRQYSTPRQSISEGNRLQGSRNEPPVTPSLMRKTSYDMDASEGSPHYSLERYRDGQTGEGEEEEEEVESADARLARADDDEPFGPRLKS